MIDRQLYDNFKEILRSELIPALGCTEPGAIAYGASQARSLLGSMPESMELWCSGNIVKNVKGVIVPNSGGMRGIEAAAVLGMLAGHSQPDDCDLEVLNSITCDDISEAEKLLKEGFCQCHLAEDTPNLYIKVLVRGNGHEAQIIIEGSHTNITGRILDGKPIYSSASCSGDDMAEKLKDHLSVKKILQFAEALTEKDGRELFSAQIRDNTAIAEEGLSGNYGARVGQTLLKTRDEGSVRARAVAKAAAGSDARMNGCTLPVVINSGSGNQGITVTVPVVEYAKAAGSDQLSLYRAMAISNLISIHIKHHIGKLSAFCGAVSASCGSGAAVAYLQGADYAQICNTISNTLGNVGGIVCDGAKASCAAKIASSLEAAFLGYDMAKDDLCFNPGEGFVEDDIEETIDNIGKIGRYGMKNTDKEILHLMLGHKDYICD